MSGPDFADPSGYFCDLCGKPKPTPTPQTPSTEAGRALLNDPPAGMADDDTYYWESGTLTDRILAIEAQARADHENELLLNHSNAWHDQVAQVARLKEALDTYGHHVDPNCYVTDEVGCRCGFDHLLANLPAAAQERDERLAELQGIVLRTAHMGLCSQTGHEHLMIAAQSALNTDASKEPGHDPHTADTEALFVVGTCPNCGALIRAKDEARAAVDWLNDKSLLSALRDYRWCHGGRQADWSDLDALRAIATYGRCPSDAAVHCTVHGRLGGPPE